MIAKVFVFIRPVGPPTSNPKMAMQQLAESPALKLAQTEPDKSSDDILEWDFNEFGEGWI
jgi:hypothetical protein